MSKRKIYLGYKRKQVLIRELVRARYYLMDAEWAVSHGDAEEAIDAMMEASDVLKLTAKAISKKTNI